MSTRPPYNQDPPSESSIYYDAPIMHFFSSKKNPTSDDILIRTETDQPVQDTAAPPPSVHPKDCAVPLGAPPSGPTPAPTADAASSPTPSRADSPTRTKQASASDAGTGTDVGYDSGYASAGGTRGRRPREPSRVSEKSARSIPIVWNGEEGTADAEREESWRRRNQSGGDGASTQRGLSLRSRRSVRSQADRASVAQSTMSERRRRISLSGGTFANGAGTVGPSSSHPPDPDFQRRLERADSLLTPKERGKIDKAQKGSVKRMSKVMKAESKAEQAALDAAIAELVNIQKMQKSAVKDETKATEAHGRILKVYSKAEAEFLAAKAKFEKVEAELQAQENAREGARSRAQEITDMLQEKSREVEFLRKQKTVDDRERAVKLKELNGKI